MSPERADAVLRATLKSIDSWVEHLAEIDAKCGACSALTSHLLSSMKQGRMCLAQIIQQDEGPDSLD